MTEKLISVIMPCFNSEQNVSRSIDSVLQQTYTNMELLIVDDGSTDSTRQILQSIQREDSRVRVFFQRNSGPGAARNRGLRESRGSYIAFLDSDDYWSPFFLEKLEKALSSKSENKFNLVYCGWQNIGMRGAGGQPFIPPDYENVNLIELCFGGCRWPIHAVLVNRECFEKVNDFDERWKNCEDFDLWLRMSIFLTVSRIPEVLSFYRHHEGKQISKNRVEVALNNWRIQNEFLAGQTDEVIKTGKDRLKKMINSELLKRAYISYWERDLDAAHKIFRMAMQAGCGRFKDWKYMMPAVLPLFLYKKLICFISRG